MDAASATTALAALAALEAFSPEEEQRRVFALATGSAGERLDAFVIGMPAKEKEAVLNIWRLLGRFDANGALLCRPGKLQHILSAVKDYTEPEVQDAALSYFMHAVLAGMRERVHESENEVVAAYIIELLASNNIGLADKARHFLEQLCAPSSTMPMAVQALVPQIYAESQKHVANFVVRLRYLALLTTVSGYSDAAFTACASCGAVEDIVSTCRRSEDVLAQMNVLELLGDVATSSAGMEYMCTHGVVLWLMDVIAGKGDASGLIEETGLRTLSDVLRKASVHTPGFLAKIGDVAVRQFVATLQQYLEEGNETRRILGVGICSDFMCISNDTLELLFSNNERLLDGLLALVRSGKAEMTAAVLHSIAKMLVQADDVYVGGSIGATNGAGEVKAAGGNGNGDMVPATVFATPATAVAAAAASSSPALSAAFARTAALKQRLWGAIGRAKGVSSTLYLLRACKQPIPSVHNAAMDVFAALASQNVATWGLHALFPSDTISVPISAQTDTFYEYVQNRTTEFSKEGKDWKFAIILALSKNPARTMLSDEVNGTIDKLIRQGPYYMPAKMGEVLTLDQGAS